jgi:hypothetical protein
MKFEHPYKQYLGKLIINPDKNWYYPTRILATQGTIKKEGGKDFIRFFGINDRALATFPNVAAPRVFSLAKEWATTKVMPITESYYHLILKSAFNKDNSKWL